jgi:hypothetical protein
MIAPLRKAPCPRNMAVYNVICNGAPFFFLFALRTRFFRAVRRHNVQNLCSPVLGKPMRVA